MVHGPVCEQKSRFGAACSDGWTEVNYRQRSTCPTSRIQTKDLDTVGNRWQECIDGEWCTLQSTLQLSTEAMGDQNPKAQ